MASSLLRGVAIQAQRPCSSCFVLPVRHNRFRHFPGLRSVASNKRMHELQDVVDKVIGVNRVCKRPLREEEVWNANPEKPTEEEARQENRPLIYLCNWEVKLVGPTVQEGDRLKFVVSMPMNKYDITQYLTQIYGLDVVHVTTAVYKGATVADVPGSRRVAFEPHYKVAFVIVRDTLFTFPSAHKLFPEHFEEDTAIPEPALRVGSDQKLGQYNFDYRAHMHQLERERNTNNIKEQPPKGLL